MHPAIASFLLAFSTYSRIPVPQAEWSDANRKYAMCFFPLIGAAAGAALWGWLALCGALRAGSMLRGAVGAALPLLVTGGIHMDGFMDSCDALASCQPREKRLEILKDTHVGAFAVIGCAGYLLLAAGLLSEASAKAGPMLAACFIASRSLSAWALAAFPSARPNGMLDGFARAANRRLVTLSSGAYLLACAAVWLVCGGLAGLICIGAAAACTLYYRRMTDRLFGGVTGDLAGWFIQVTELALIAAVVLGGML